MTVHKSLHGKLFWCTTLLFGCQKTLTVQGWKGKN